MTATFDIAPIINNDLKVSMGLAALLVQRAKAKDTRGTITLFRAQPTEEPT
ncbi:MAG: hypothetical protein M3014_07980 [Chloroflexota bacterium]|nr:hypothetical protein [Chloroflexota bacterium]